jgi:hypothetical protein
MSPLPTRPFALPAVVIADRPLELRCTGEQGRRTGASPGPLRGPSTTALPFVLAGSAAPPYDGSGG